MAEGDKYTDLLGVRKVALGLPNSADQAGYNGLDWAVLKGVVNWPDQGDEYTDASEATLDTGRTEHRAGAVDGGVIELPVTFVEADPGQAILLANIGNNAVISFQDVDVDGTARFFYGVLLAGKRRAKTETSFKGHIFKIGVNSPVFTGVEDS